MPVARIPDLQACIVLEKNEDKVECVLTDTLLPIHSSKQYNGTHENYKFHAQKTASVQLTLFTCPCLRIYCHVFLMGGTCTYLNKVHSVRQSPCNLTVQQTSFEKCVNFFPTI